ncbi:unnamed protein product [Chrysoparadoxa australica]
MVAVPLIKIFTLTVKTMVKPLAKKIKKEATEHPRIGSALGQLGQSVHFATTWLRIRAQGHAVASIKPLDPPVAISRGGELLSEAFVYSTAIGLMAWEYRGSAIASKEKEAKANWEKAEQARKLKEDLEAVHKRLDAMEGKLYGSQGIWGLGLGIIGKRKRNQIKSPPACEAVVSVTEPEGQSGAGPVTTAAAPAAPAGAPAPASSRIATVWETVKGHSQAKDSAGESGASKAVHKAGEKV